MWWKLRDYLKFCIVTCLCTSDTNFESDFRVSWVFFSGNDIRMATLRGLFLFVALLKLNQLLYYFCTTNRSVFCCFPAASSQYLPYKVMMSSKILCCVSPANSKVVSLLWFAILELCGILTVAQPPQAQTLLLTAWLGSRSLLLEMLL